MLWGVDKTQCLATAGPVIGGTGSDNGDSPGVSYQRERPEDGEILSLNVFVFVSCSVSVLPTQPGLVCLSTREASKTHRRSGTRLS